MKYKIYKYKINIRHKYQILPKNKTHKKWKNVMLQFHNAPETLPLTVPLNITNQHRPFKIRP